MSNDVCIEYFQAIADVLFPSSAGKKNLVEVSDMMDATEVQLFKASAGFTIHFLIFERADNSFEKTESQAFTDVDGSLFVMGAVDRQMQGIAATKDMIDVCEAYCKQIFDTMVHDGEQMPGRALYDRGIEVETKAPGNWATMLNQYWGYKIDFKWRVQENLYYGPVINHNF